ncbi:coiled-coil domain-containing protein 6-like isoform X2 [Ptychodera flava]|uniref:coiled-coil domain-containing protein 6-like isoform X2 n=1 Tax=Ptychodera flava TaxID=63121 RepID=UPI00396A96EF
MNLIAGKMADSASESDTDSTKLASQDLLEQLRGRIASLEQQNRVLKIELETFKLKCKAFQEENRELRKASVSIQARAEQEEEYISNTLLKKIHALKKEKEKLAVNYEQEEEFLTNDLSRKLMQLRQEKVQLEQTLEQEQEFQVNKLMRKIEKLESETTAKQQSLEQLRREKVDLENTLEQEQESLVNRLWKRMDRLEAEKRMLQEKLDQPVSGPPSPREIKNGDSENLTIYVQQLRNEVHLLKKKMEDSQAEHSEKMARYAEEEKHIKEENLRLQRKLLMEMERREALSRQLSESESSLEMDDERQFNEMASHGNLRPRTRSSPIPYSPSSSRPMSPGHYNVAFTPPSPMSRCSTCGNTPYHSTPSGLSSTSPPPIPHVIPAHRTRIMSSPDKFMKPTSPTS